MTIEIRTTPFDPYAEASTYQASRPEIAGKHGATALFVGTMREFNEGSEVTGMTLEHYPGMTEKYLEKIATEATERWGVIESLILHRVGPLQPDEPIVLVAVWSAHRREAFEACRWLMEELKSKAPFWKKETLEGGERWVEHNTPG
ncbi:molybdenum cofactor biosynthesis protein MoaE [Endothiovibrio diazotrophicus]